MKLQLWTTDANGEPDELLGEIDVDDGQWADAQTGAGEARELIQELASEVNA